MTKKMYFNLMNEILLHFVNTKKFIASYLFGIEKWSYLFIINQLKINR